MCVTSADSPKFTTTQWLIRVQIRLSDIEVTGRESIWQKSRGKVENIYIFLYVYENMCVYVYVYAHIFSYIYMGFPGDSAGKESLYNVGDLGSIPGL